MRKDTPDPFDAFLRKDENAMGLIMHVSPQIAHAVMSMLDAGATAEEVLAFCRERRRVSKVMTVTMEGMMEFLENIEAEMRKHEVSH